MAAVTDRGGHVTAHEETTAITTTQFYPTTGTATEDAKSAAGAAKGEAAAVARAAGTAASDVAVTAKEQVGQVAGEARTQISTLTSQAREQVSEQATAQTHKVAGQARSFGEQLQALARGEATEGPAVDLIRELGERVQQIADQLESKRPQELLDDVRRYARNKPGTFLLGAMAAGFIGGRLMKAAGSAGSQSQPTYGTGGSVYRRPDPAYLGGERFASNESIYPEEPARTSGMGEAI
jgi:hypothetical protein